MLGILGQQLLRSKNTITDLSDIIPTKSDAIIAYRQWIRKSKSILLKDGSNVNKPLSDDSLRRRRARFAPSKEFALWGDRFAPVVSLYFKFLRKSAKVIFVSIFSVMFCCFYRQVSEDVIVSIFKDLSTLAKKYRELLFGNDWWYFVDINTCTDFKENVDILELKPELLDWVANPRVHAIGGNKWLFMHYFKEGLRAYFSRARPKIDIVHVTLQQFCDDPMYWAKSGTSDGKRLSVDTDQGVKFARKSKWASAMAMTPEDVYNTVMSNDIQSNTILQKREKTKVRPVIVGDLQLYNKCSFISLWTDQFMAGHPDSVIFYSGKQLFNLWCDMYVTAKDQTRVKMPLDQSNFDHQVNLEMVIAYIDVLTEVIIKNVPTCYNITMLIVMTKIKRAVSTGYVKVFNQGKLVAMIAVVNGLLSGGRWTAEMGGAINAAELYTAKKVVVQRTGVDPIIESEEQGDDDRVICVTIPAAVLVWAVYVEANFDVNAKKFFISLNTDEFLRQIVTEDRVQGYPARAMATMFWRNPVTREQMPGEDRVREMAEAWNQLLSRCKAEDHHYDYAVRDIAAANRLSTIIVKMILGTPACVGGVGWLDECEEWLSITKSTRLQNWKFSTIPPCAIALSVKYSVSEFEIADSWQSNVEGPGSVSDEYVKFEVNKVEKILPIENISNISPLATGQELLFIIKQDITPSIRMILLSRIIEQEDWSRLDEIASVRSLTILPIIIKHCTKRVLIAWLKGKLPYHVPVRKGWSGLGVSHYYNIAAKFMWAWCLSRHKINYALVLRSAYTAELITRNLLLSAAFKISG